MPAFERIAADVPVTLKGASYVIVPEDTGTEIQFLASSTVDAQLPGVSTVENGFNIVIRNMGAGSLTILPADGDAIDGGESVVLSTDDWRWIRNDGTTWKSLSASLDAAGNVTGPGSSSDNAIARFNGTSGDAIQNSAAFIDDSGNITANNLSGTNTGDQTIGLSGDVTGSGTGTFAATISNNAVTYAKMQDVSAASKLLGRGDSGSGDPQEITLGSGLSMSGTTLSASGSGTTLTGDVTGSGTGSIATTIANNAVTYAKMQDVSAASKLLGRGDSGSGDPQEITLGSGLSMSGTTLSASGSGVTLTGDVTGTGSGSVATTIANDVVTPAMLTEEAKPYDFSFVAGYDASMVLQNLNVQTYAQLVVARPLTIEGEVGYIDTAATGAAVVVDVLKNGNTIYSTPPSFATSSNTITAGTLSTTTLASGDRLTFRVTQTGSTVVGQGLRFTLKTHLA